VLLPSLSTLFVTPIPDFTSNMLREAAVGRIQILADASSYSVNFSEKKLRLLREGRLARKWLSRCNRLIPQVCSDESTNLFRSINFVAINRSYIYILNSEAMKRLI
jgi:hypothetical protein